MAWQGPGGGTAPGDGDPSLDETRTDWALPDPPLTPPPSGGEPLAPASPQDAPPPPVPSAPAYPAYPGYPAPGATYTPAPGGIYGSPGSGGTPPGMTWAPPDAGYGPLNPSGLRFADVGNRFVAWLVDVLILAGIGLVVSATLSALVLGSLDWSAWFRQVAVDDGGVTFPDAGAMGRLLLVSVVGSVITATLDFVYFAFLWSSRGRATIGMRLLRLEIGNASDGRTLSLGQAARRWVAMGTWLSLLGAVPMVGGLAGLGQLAWYIALLVTTSSHPARQGLHDRFAGTAVVQKEPAGNAFLIGCLVLVGFFVLLSVISVVALIFLGSQVSTILEEVGNSI